MLPLMIRNRPEWTEDALFLDFCEKHKLTYDAVVEANRNAYAASKGWIGGNTLETSYRTFYEREFPKCGCSASLAHQHAVLAVARLALTQGK